MAGALNNNVQTGESLTGQELLSRIRLRLSDPDRLDLLRDSGDHILNPDLGPYARSKGPPRDAAVLIPIVDLDPEPTVILTLRTGHLSSHAGQVAFPGGKIDQTDGGPVEAAIREAEEEIDLKRAVVHPFGRLPAYLTGSGYKVIPVVADVSPARVLTLNPNEVEDVFEVPLSFLMDPAQHHKQSLEWKGAQRFFYSMPYENRKIWGVTAGIIRSLYETVFGS
ncbi:CoA pyrophosphatase [Roseibium sp. RKSG952]|uniref:CoA pyrophosphatase n=1 Tax=Roseibium sp. RKSG952 TaxID=2529384 RepID=UPI0012BCB53F|nr:CoA pyrophosphatase [Roseibium sp. RKSG952]MTH98415.1 CoA pyrophosphatase [Roseibium sp. RKSG952]